MKSKIIQPNPNSAFIKRWLPLFLLRLSDRSDFVLIIILVACWLTGLHCTKLLRFCHSKTLDNHISARDTSGTQQTNRKPNTLSPASLSCNQRETAQPCDFEVLYSDSTADRWINSWVLCPKTGTKIWQILSVASVSTA